MKRLLMMRLSVWIILFYRATLGPWLGGNCRFQPTCSEYALDAFKKYGVMKGWLKTVRRLSKCHPWGRSGYDPA